MPGRYVSASTHRHNAMAMYADCDYYTAYFSGVLPDKCGWAQRYLRQASAEIDRFTFGRFGGVLPEDEADVVKLQDCTCELAETLYRIDQAREAAASTATVNGVKTAGPIASVSSGSESISYKTVESAYTEAARSAEKRDALVYSIIRRYMTGVAVNGVNVLYCGVM